MHDLRNCIIHYLEFHPFIYGLKDRVHSKTQIDNYETHYKNWERDFFVRYMSKPNKKTETKNNRIIFFKNFLCIFFFRIFSFIFCIYFFCFIEL